MMFSGAPLDTPCDSCGDIMEYAYGVVDRSFAIVTYRCGGCTQTYTRPVRGECLEGAVLAIRNGTAR